MWVTIRGLSPAEREQDTISTPEEFSGSAQTDQPSSELGYCPLGRTSEAVGVLEGSGQILQRTPERGWGWGWGWASRARRAFPARGTHSARSL